MIGERGGHEVGPGFLGELQSGSLQAICNSHLQLKKDGWTQGPATGSHDRQGESVEWVRMRKLAKYPSQKSEREVAPGGREDFACRCWGVVRLGRNQTGSARKNC